MEKERVSDSNRLDSTRLNSIRLRAEWCSVIGMQTKAKFYVRCVVIFLVCFFRFVFVFGFAFFFWIVMKLKSIYDYGYGIDIKISLVGLVLFSCCCCCCCMLLRLLSLSLFVSVSVFCFAFRKRMIEFYSNFFIWFFRFGQLFQLPQSGMVLMFNKNYSEKKKKLPKKSTEYFNKKKSIVHWKLCDAIGSKKLAVLLCHNTRNRKERERNWRPINWNWKERESHYVAVKAVAMTTQRAQTHTHNIISWANQQRTVRAINISRLTLTHTHRDDDEQILCPCFITTIINSSWILINRYVHIMPQLNFGFSVVAVAVVHRSHSIRFEIVSISTNFILFKIEIVDFRC